MVRVALMLFMILTSMNVKASDVQTLTIGHVFQKTQSIIKVLESMGGTIPSKDLFAASYVPDRKTHHVIFMAREVLSKTEIAKAMSGEVAHETLPLEIKHITVKDVMEVVNHLDRNIQLLCAVKQHCVSNHNVAFLDHKNASDVYNNLRIMGYQLEQIFDIRITPSDVSHVLSGVLWDIEMLYGHQKRPLPEIQEPEVERDYVVRPLDMYYEVKNLHEAVRNVTKGSVFKAADEIIMLPDPKRKILPHDVIHMLHTILAELHEIKRYAGMLKPMRLQPLQKGVTPTDAYIDMKRARLLIKALD